MSGQNKKSLEERFCAQCAALSSAAGDSPSPACSPREVLMEEQLRILEELRTIKREYRQHRLSLEQMVGTQSFDADMEKSRLTRRIDNLRDRWSRLEEELERANRLNWIRLGYQP